MSESVLVLGGGLTGLQAALELAAAGVTATVVERGPIVGGKRAAVLAGDVDPRLAALAEEANISFLTLAELDSLAGEEGEFVATVRQLPRYVNDDCTRCNHCAPVCPQAVPNEYDAGLTYRKAIHNPFPRTIPDIYAIDIDSCLNMPPNYLPCQRCVEVCDDRAIHFDITPPQPLELPAAAVIVATGYAVDDQAEREQLAEFGYGQHPDVVSSVELQRMLEDPGPSGGFATRPSDEGYPDSVMLVLTRVSEGAAWVMGNQLRRLVAQRVEKVQLLVLAADPEDALLAPLRAVASECGIEMACGTWIGVDSEDSGQLLARYATLPGGGHHRLAVDLLVLSSEVHPHPEAAALAAKLGLECDPQGYLQASRAGIYLAGGVLGTVGVEAGGEQARAVAREVVRRLRVQEAAIDKADEGPRLQELEQLLHALIRLGGQG